MEFSWPNFVAVMFYNTIYVWIMFLVQDLDENLQPRHSFIVGTRQKFLYIQDFWTMTYGDWFGIPFIISVFVHLAIYDIANLWWALVIGFLGTILFTKMCLSKDHKPDYGFPETGKISLAGKWHLLYFGFGIGASAMCLLNLSIGNLPWGPVLWVALIGGAIYISCFILDIRSGNFDQLKTEGQKQRHLQIQVSSSTF